MTDQRVELTVRVGDADAQVFKAGQGPPLVYLHGAFGYQGRRPFLDLLARRFTVYAPLHPGFSESNGIDGIDDVLDLALYHFDLLDALGLESPHLVGHFFGAMIVAEMTALCPHRANKLVLASPAGLWLDESPGVDYFATPANELRSVLFNDPDSDVARETFPEPESEELRDQLSIDRARSLSTLAKFLWPIPDKGLSKRLGRIRASALIVMADNDKIVPAPYGGVLTQRIQGSRLRVIRDAGHMYVLERSDEFADLVAEFLVE